MLHCYIARILHCYMAIGRSEQLLLNKFFDLSTPSMRNGRDGEKRGNKAFVGLGSCDNVQTESSILKYAN